MSLATLTGRIAAVETTTRKHNVDLYEGDGPKNPSIVTRMALVEDSLFKIANNLRGIAFLLVSAIVAVTIDFIYHTHK